MPLVVYGSFNCPYSFLASQRVDRLARDGVTEAQWRAVVHDPDVPAGGTAVTGELAGMFDSELSQIRGLLLPGEPYPARRPPVQPNTTRAVATYAAATAGDAVRLRDALFRAFWVDGLDIGDPAVLSRLGCPQEPDTATMQCWRGDWLGLGKPMVPMMVLPDGVTSRGLGALKRLAEMITAGPPA